MYFTTCVRIQLASSRSSLTLHPCPKYLCIYILCQVFFYGAPLEAMSRVIRTRNSDAIHVPTMVMNWINTTFWMAYGFARMDPIIYAPNGVGLVLGIAQGILVCAYPRHRNHPVDEDDIHADEANVSLVVDDDDDEDIMIREEHNLVI